MARRRVFTPPIPRKAEYTAEELDQFALDDLRVDAETSEAQAANGPFYPDKGITAESLREYAALMRAKLAQYANGGAHRALIQNTL